MTSGGGGPAGAARVDSSGDYHVLCRIPPTPCGTATQMVAAFLPRAVGLRPCPWSSRERAPAVVRVVVFPGDQKIEEQLIREVARDVELGFGMESSGRAP